MILDILTHTPVYVWAMLAFFIYRGLAARRDRDVPVWTLLILPAVLLALAIQGILNHYGSAPAPLGSWLIAALCGAFAGALSLSPHAVAVGQKGILMRGSWLPLVLVLAVFATKYCTEVLFVVEHDTMTSPAAVLGVCALYGLLTGFFMGRLGKALWVYRSLMQGGPIASLNARGVA
jgi:hypothetical protein